MGRLALAVSVAAAVAFAGVPGVAGASSPEGGERPYIVVMRAGADAAPTAGDHTRRLGAKVSQLLRGGLEGYAARIPSSRLAALRADPRVAYVEPDLTVRASAQVVPWGIDRVDADSSTAGAGNGSGAVGKVNEYIIDTGASNADLSVVAHGNWTGDGKNYDCDGHGTHVAGTVGARDNATGVVGAAPGVTMVGLKVLDCAGSGVTSNVIAAVNWVTAYAIKPAVVNMSLGGTPSQALDDAVRRSVSSGVLYVVAAGNDGADACGSSPSRAGGGTSNGIITVAATDSSNREASFSDYGSCIDLWAPGVRILSTSNTGGTATMSGTSMAAPHVAGVAGLFLSRFSWVSPAVAEANLKAGAVAPGTVSRDGRPILLVSARRY